MKLEYPFILSKAILVLIVKRNFPFSNTIYNFFKDSYFFMSKDFEKALKELGQKKTRVPFKYLFNTYIYYLGTLYTLKFQYIQLIKSDIYTLKATFIVY